MPAAGIVHPCWLPLWRWSLVTWLFHCFRPHDEIRRALNYSIIVILKLIRGQKISFWINSSKGNDDLGFSVVVFDIRRHCDENEDPAFSIKLQKRRLYQPLSIYFEKHSWENSKIVAGNISHGGSNVRDEIGSSHFPWSLIYKANLCAA